MSAATDAHTRWMFMHETQLLQCVREVKRMGPCYVLRRCRHKDVCEGPRDLQVDVHGGSRD